MERAGRAVIAGTGMGAIMLSFGNIVNAQEGAAAEPEMTDEEMTKEYLDAIETFGWTREGQGDIGSYADIAIPSGYRFSGKDGASKLLQLWGNPGSVSNAVVTDEDANWAVFFDFEESGYVKDDEKDELDPEKLLKELRAGQKEANEYRKQQGMETLELVGWATEPFYNQETNNLEWGLTLRDESGGESINYKTKLLGRNGVMDVTLICDPEEVSGLMTTYRGLLSGFNYKDGKKYADYKDGDKVSKYGLTALVIGGAAFGAAKLGLFAVLGKFFAKAGKAIVVAIVAIGVGIKKFFTRGSGRIDA
jgi:uncharacterized membrane-anchored protein